MKKEIGMGRSRRLWNASRTIIDKLPVYSTTHKKKFACASLPRFAVEIHLCLFVVVYCQCFGFLRRVSATISLGEFSGEIF